MLPFCAVGRRDEKLAGAIELPPPCRAQCAPVVPFVTLASGCFSCFAHLHNSRVAGEGEGGEGGGEKSTLA